MVSLKQTKNKHNPSLYTNNCSFKEQITGHAVCPVDNHPQLGHCEEWTVRIKPGIKWFVCTDKQRDIFISTECLVT